MSETTEIALALISTVGGLVSAWMAGRSQRHATRARGAARFIAQSLHPPEQHAPELHFDDDEYRLRKSPPPRIE